MLIYVCFIHAKDVTTLVAASGFRGAASSDVARLASNDLTALLAQFRLRNTSVSEAAFKCGMMRACQTPSNSLAAQR